MKILLGLFMLGSVVAVAQGRLEFEVATIKPLDRNIMNLMGADVLPGGRVKITGISLKGLVAAAYSIPFARIGGGESWMETVEYNVDAKPPDSANITNLRHSYWDVEDERLQAMLRALLADRFQLKVRRETKTSDVYHLVRTNKPLALRPVATPNTNEEVQRTARGTAGWAGTWVLNAISMPQLAQFASQYMVKVPVTDNTGLTGLFDYKQVGPPEDATSDRTDSFLSLMDEVGLKLEKSKGEVESIVIESASKPSEN